MQSLVSDLREKVSVVTQGGDQAARAKHTARDKLLPSDPPSTQREDSFFDITSATLGLSYRW